MKPARLLSLAMCFGAAISSQAALAVIDPGATVVKLRTSCSEGGVTLNNCFTSMSGTSGLQNWVDNVRTGATNNTSGPLDVEIGPGTFGGFTCNKNNISLKGSGPAQTILLRRHLGSASRYGIESNGCSNFNVQDLTVNGNVAIAIAWNGGGSSQWTNVTVESQSSAWAEVPGNTSDKGCQTIKKESDRSVHYWFNSRLRGMGLTYIAVCSENWFFGSEIMATSGGTVGTSVAALMVNTTFGANTFGATTSVRPEVHVYGSVIRVKADPGFTYPTPNTGGNTGSGLMAVAAGRNADVHIHGTGIDLIGNELPNDIAALAAWDGGTIHANEAAYNLKTGAGGAVTRILMDTNLSTAVHAPYLWGQYPTPQHPSLPNITSVTGADTAVITSTSDGHPHLVIYDKTCTTQTKWYDTVDKVCLP